MKENDRLKILFDRARSEKPVADLDNVEKLVKSGKKVSSGKIKPGKPGRGLFNPLNLIIMILTVTVITSLLIIFNGKPIDYNEIEALGIHVYEYPEKIERTESQIADTNKT
jgi:hypothetical protein